MLTFPVPTGAWPMGLTFLSTLWLISTHWRNALWANIRGHRKVAPWLSVWTTSQRDIKPLPVDASHVTRRINRSRRDFAPISVAVCTSAEFGWNPAEVATTFALFYCSNIFILLLQSMNLFDKRHDSTASKRNTERDIPS